MTITISKPSSLPSSLLAGVESIIVDLLGVTSTRHRSALHKLSAVDGPALVDRLFRQIRANYNIGGASARKDRSRENWRWRSLHTQISQRNRSAEVVVERAIAAACAKLGRTDWANQVPVASGLIAGARDGRRAIDLVRRRDKQHFELIELKIASDTPLYAAVEIIGYGCLWLIARSDPPARPSELLLANRIDLRVLAPRDYYSRFALTELETALNDGVSALGMGHDVALSFAFEQLDSRIRPGTMPSDEELISLIENTVPVTEAPKR
jgi:hypothetical protein